MLLASGQKPFGADDIRPGKRSTRTIPTASLSNKGCLYPSFRRKKRPQVIHGASRRYEFILYEYFQTDLYAHRRPFADCVGLIRDLDALVATLLSRLDKRSDTLVLTSDHGNLEDFHLRGHSRNPVPLMAWGKHGDSCAQKIKSLSDVTPALY